MATILSALGYSKNVIKSCYVKKYYGFCTDIINNLMASTPNKRQRMENVEGATGCPPKTSEPVDVKDGAGDSSRTNEPVDVKYGAGRSYKKPYKPRSYWVENHGVDNLEELFARKETRATIGTLLSVGSVKILVPGVYYPKHVLELKSMLNTSTSPETENVDLLLAYLKDRGYFNVVEQSDGYCTLEIPNREIKDEIVKKFCNVSYYTEKYKLNPEQISNYQNALLTLDWNREESFQVLANVVADMFAGNVPRPQNHAELLGMLYTFANVMSHTDVHSEIFYLLKKRCRLDLLIFRKVDGTGIIIEVKLSPFGTAREGLEQIFDKALGLCISKQKICLGLHFNDSTGVVTVCAFSTDATAADADKKFETEEKCITKESIASGS